MGYAVSSRTGPNGEIRSAKRAAHGVSGDDDVNQAPPDRSKTAKTGANQNNPWYIILPNGSVIEWDGTPGQNNGPPVPGITADPNIYTDPSLLTDAFTDNTVNSSGFDQLTNFYFASNDELDGLNQPSACHVWENYDPVVDAK